MPRARPARSSAGARRVPGARGCDRGDLVCPPPGDRAGTGDRLHAPTVPAAAHVPVGGGRRVADLAAAVVDAEVKMPREPARPRHLSRRRRRPRRSPRARHRCAASASAKAGPSLSNATGARSPRRVALRSASRASPVRRLGRNKALPSASTWPGKPRCRPAKGPGVDPSSTSCASTSPRACAEFGSKSGLVSTTCSSSSTTSLTSVAPRSRPRAPHLADHPPSTERPYPWRTLLSEVERASATSSGLPKSPVKGCSSGRRGRGSARRLRAGAHRRRDQPGRHDVQRTPWRA